VSTKAIDAMVLYCTSSTISLVISRTVRSPNTLMQDKPEEMSFSRTLLPTWCSPGSTNLMLMFLASRLWNSR
jgi:hypothetical protein